jgi:hypothetical protein
MKSLIIIIFVVFLVSCDTKNEPNKTSSVSDIESNYSINYLKNNMSCFLNIVDNNDTVYLYRFIDNKEEKLKIVMNQKTINRIKKSVIYHLNMDVFFINRPKTFHGDMIRFYSHYSNNKIEAKYTELDNYRNVSPNFDSLITFLVQENNLFKKHFE